MSRLDVIPEPILDTVAGFVKRTGLYALAITLLVIGLPVCMFFVFSFCVLAGCYVLLKEVCS